MPRLLRILENELAGLDIAAGAPGEELLGGPRGVGGSTVAMAKGKKKKSAKKLALAEDAKAETKADGEFDAALNRPSLAALASAGAPGAASTPSRSGKQLWALDSVNGLAPAATKKRSMFMSAYKSLKRAAGIPSKKDRPAEKANVRAGDASTSTRTSSAPPRLDGTLPDVRAKERVIEHAIGDAMKIPRLDTAKVLAGLRDADAERDRRGSESHAAYLDALRRALPSDVRPDRTDRTAPVTAAATRERKRTEPSVSRETSRETPRETISFETAEPSETAAESVSARLPEAPAAPRPTAAAAAAAAAAALSPPRARFAQTMHRLVGNMRRRHESSISTARGMLASLDALEGLEPAAVAFGRVQRRADAAFWSGLPPVTVPFASDAVQTAVQTASAHVGGGEERHASRGGSKPADARAVASSNERRAFGSALGSWLAPATKPPTPRVVEARHEERRDAEAAARESESFAFWAPNVAASRSASAPVSPSGASFPRTEGKEAAFAASPGREAGLFRAANVPAAAAVAAAAARVTPPASVARRLAAAEAMHRNGAETSSEMSTQMLSTRRSGSARSERDASSSSEDSFESERAESSAPRFRTRVAGRGGSRFSAGDETSRTSREAPTREDTKPSAAALAAARARDAARRTRDPPGDFSRDDSSYGGGAPSPPPTRRAGDLDRLRAMRRRLQAEYEDEARAMRAQSVPDAPSSVPGSATPVSARNQIQQRDGRVPSEASPRRGVDGSARRSARNALPEGAARRSEEETWHDLARLGGFASFEDVPSSAKPLDVPSARLRAAYAMEGLETGRGGGETRGGAAAAASSEDVAAAATAEPFFAPPSAPSLAPRDGFVPRAVGSPATAKAGFDALYRRREARRAAEANAVGRPRTGGDATRRDT